MAAGGNKRQKDPQKGAQQHFPLFLPHDIRDYFSKWWQAGDFKEYEPYNKEYGVWKPPYTSWKRWDSDNFQRVSFLNALPTLKTNLKGAKQPVKQNPEAPLPKYGREDAPPPPEVHKLPRRIVRIHNTIRLHLRQAIKPAAAIRTRTAHQYERNTDSLGRTDRLQSLSRRGIGTIAWSLLEFWICFGAELSNPILKRNTPI